MQLLKWEYMYNLNYHLQFYIWPFACTASMGSLLAHVHEARQLLLLSSEILFKIGKLLP